jgi:hypothetical protein
MFLDSELCYLNKPLLSFKLMQWIPIYFGVNIEGLSNEFYDIINYSIIDRFKDITILDVENSFKHAKIQKKQYVSLTRDELLEPINEYWIKKQQVQLEIDLISQMKKEEIEAINKDFEFKYNCKQKYIESLKQSKMLLDEFESNCIARMFKDRFTMDEKQIIVKEAQQEHRQRIKDNENNQFQSVPSWEKIYARIFIENCLNRGYKYIQE